MKTTSDIRSVALIKKIATAIYPYKNMEILIVNKQKKYAYYIAGKDSEEARFVFCTDKENDIGALIEKGVFDGYEQEEMA